MNHNKQEEVELLLKNNIPVLLEGPTGTGKTTILQKAAKAAGVSYSFIAGTRQTTVSNVLGFMSVSGTYVPSVFRKAYVEGHYFNIDEIDAMDPNALLVFNSLENNIVAFPDGYSEPPHKDFRLCATANPRDAHDRHTGRAVLDEATLDRFDIITLNIDPEMEAKILSEDTFRELTAIRLAYNSLNIVKHISLRDGLRLDKRKVLGLADKYIDKLLNNDEDLTRVYTRYLPEKLIDQSKVETVDELWNIIRKEKENEQSNATVQHKQASWNPNAERW